MPQVVVERNYGEAKRAIVKGLVAFNRAAVGKQAWKQIAVTVRDEGRIVGGALGALWLEWMFVELLWLGDAFRGRDIGTELMSKLEEEARRRGAKHAMSTPSPSRRPASTRSSAFASSGALIHTSKPMRASG
jgi:GNAT superfamily N-acetyltransferase